MQITDRDFDWHMRWVKGENAREKVRDMVAYLRMGGYCFPTANPMREVQWVAIQMGLGKVWDWESKTWVKQEKNDEVA